MIKTTFGRAFLALAAAAALFILPVTHVSQAASGGAMSDAEKKEIGAVVREYLLNNPEILRDMMAALEAKENREKAKLQGKALEENADGIFRDKRDVVLGNPDGDVTLVEFFDYNCGFCKRALGDLHALLETDKKLRVVMKEFPILSAGSLGAARVSLGVAKQDKYMAFHSALMNSRGQANEERALAIAEKLGLDMKKLKADMNEKDIMDSITSAAMLARSLGINGTPAYIIDGAVISGAVGVEALREQIARVREEGCKYC